MLWIAYQMRCCLHWL